MQEPKVLRTAATDGVCGTRRQVEDMAGPEGAFRRPVDAGDVLDGISRITFKMSTVSLDAESMKRSIELPANQVAPVTWATHAESWVAFPPLEGDA